MYAADPVPDLYLAPSSRPLLFSVAAALLADHPAEIVYMNDYAPLPPAVEARLRKLYPQITFTLRTDRQAAEDFATLPAWMPGILRRNLAPMRDNWLAGPADRPPTWLAPRYRNAYIYVTGPFLTKTLRNRCDRIILREDGLGNYHPRQVGWGKAVLRGLTGLPPRHHFMGEESWVDAIELARPEDLPARLRPKARQRRLTEFMEALPPAASHQLAEAFWTAPPFAMTGPGALVLQQPLESLGISTRAEARAIYAGIADRLRQAGYEVCLKPHPQETTPFGAGLTEIPPFFPIEAWPWVTPYRFAVAVALCSAALDSDKSPFSEAQFQLVRPENFARGDLSGWTKVLDAGLAGLQLSPATPAG
jgi:hypothetical protein